MKNGDCAHVEETHGQEKGFMPTQKNKWLGALSTKINMPVMRPDSGNQEGVFKSQPHIA